MDAIVQQLFADAGPLAQPVGGLRARRLRPPRAVPALRHRPPGALRRHHRRRRRALSARVPEPAVGPRPDRRPSRARGARRRRRSSPDNPEFLLALTDARPVVGDATLLDQFLAASDAARTATRTLDALKALIAERHARFNDTLYQLEPDVKESPGGLRDLFGAQTDRQADRSRAARRRAVPGRARWTTPKSSCCACARCCTSRPKRHHNVLSHELQERAAECLGYARLARRASASSASWATTSGTPARSIARCAGPCKAAPTPIGRNLVRAADGMRFVDSREAAEHPETWLALFQAAHRRRLLGVPTMRSRASSRTRAGSRPRPSSRRRRIATRCCDFLKPRPGLYARLSEMHDCRPARADAARSSRRSTAASCATSTTSTRSTSTRC